MVFYLDLVKRYLFVPGKVENWVILIDTNNVGLLGLPFKLLNQVISITQTNYMAALEDLYIMNPSFSLNTSWSIISAMIHKDTIAKIHFLKKSQYHKLQDRIDADQLEKKYGGTLPDLTEFWPPRNLSKEPPFEFPWEAYIPHQPRIVNGEFDPLPIGSNPPKEQPTLQKVQEPDINTHAISTELKNNDQNAVAHHHHLEEEKVMNEASTKHNDPHPLSRTEDPFSNMKEIKTHELTHVEGTIAADKKSTTNQNYVAHSNETTQNVKPNETTLQEKNTASDTNSMRNKELQAKKEDPTDNYVTGKEPLKTTDGQLHHVQIRSDNQEQINQTHTPYPLQQNEKSTKNEDGYGGFLSEKNKPTEWKAEEQEGALIQGGDKMTQNRASKKNAGNMLNDGEVNEGSASTKPEFQVDLEGNEASIRSRFCGFCSSSSRQTENKSGSQCSIF